MIIVRLIIQYHKWKMYERLAIDSTIILGKILRYFVNWAAVLLFCHFNTTHSTVGVANTSGTVE